MSYVVRTGDDGEKYRGGYSSGPSLKPDELRVATSTFENYIEGTVALVFIVFACFLFITILAFMLMCYARYINGRQPKSGFYNPPPRLTRYPGNNGKRSHGAAYGGSTITRSDYSSLQRQHATAPSAMSHAQSQHSEML